MIKKLLKNQLVKGSFIVFVGGMIGNVANYLYHLLMGRMLGPVNYGILASLISLTYLLAIPNGTLNLVVTKYVSSLSGKGQKKEIARFYRGVSLRIFYLILVGFIFFLLSSKLISDFLHLDSPFLVLLMSVSGLVGFYVTNGLAVLGGLLRFTSVTILGVLQAIIKLSVSLGLVYLGLGVLGASLPFLIISLVSLIWVAVLLNGFLVKDDERKSKVAKKDIVNYSWPVFLSNLSFTSLFTTDVILAKHYLPTEWAGYYAALATLGKILFFATGPITTVMFPLVANYYERGKSYKKILGLSLLLVFSASLLITLVYFVAPELMVKILYGSSFLPAARYLPLFAIFISFYALSSLLVNFYLSVKRTKIVFLPVVASFLQVVLIFIFHQNLAQVVTMSMIVLGLLFLSLIVYYLTNGAEKKN